MLLRCISIPNLACLIARLIDAVSASNCAVRGVTVGEVSLAACNALLRSRAILLYWLISSVELSSVNPTLDGIG